MTSSASSGWLSEERADVRLCSCVKLELREECDQGRASVEGGGAAETECVGMLWLLSSGFAGNKRFMAEVGDVSGAWRGSFVGVALRAGMWSERGR